uniref:Ribosome recycling factor domain-containing protein n=1 Tax=Chaetoceros debilis TaxID=122233 RepID=A0A7S3PXG2_9STRA|mmetsp:Transcript_29576/g.45155  ORF Transcript_29576/g.45155 Transcript_29576/m.45155 type:complete len:314 (+) Transcript_29576:162-1103(+)
MSSILLQTCRLAASQSRRPALLATATKALGVGIEDASLRSSYGKMQIRSFGRKGGRMGKHLQNLDEMAHREAKKKGNNNKKGKKSNDEASAPATMSYEVEEIVIEEDENETKFDHGGNEDDDETPSLPKKDDVKGRMMKVVNNMEDSFKAIRGAEPSAELFDSVQVKAYGAMTPLSGVAQVVIASPTLATISCFDPDTAPGVRDAVRDMPGMNFNPQIDEGTVNVVIPRVSAETRLAIVKQLKNVAESTRQRVRRIRRAAQDVVKKGKDGNLGPGISEDDAFRAGKDIDAVTDECIQALNQVVELKEEDVMKV